MTRSPRPTISRLTRERALAQSLLLDSTDVQGVFALAKKSRVQDVLSPATDVAVISAAAAAEALGLAGPIDSARILTVKTEFRFFFSRERSSSSRFLAFRRAHHAADYLDQPSAPRNKAHRSSGSKGVFIFDNQANFARLALESLNFSLDKTEILEDFLPGGQHTAEGLLSAGHARAVLVTDRQTAPRPYVATWGHLIPSGLNDAN